MNASQYRYLEYVYHVTSAMPNYVPLGNDFNLNSITLCSVPVFDRVRNGCTPYVEIFAKDQKIYSNLQNYQALR